MKRATPPFSVCDFGRSLWIACGLAVSLLLVCIATPSVHAQGSDARSADAEQTDAESSPDAATDPSGRAGSTSDAGSAGERRSTVTPLPSDPDSLDPPTRTEPPTTGTDLGTMLLETFLVLAAVCLIAYVVLRWGVQRLVGADDPDSGGAIEVLARQPISAETTIVVVRIGPEKTLVLAECDSKTTRIGELEDGETEELLADRPEEDTTDSWIPTFFRREGSTP